MHARTEIIKKERERDLISLITLKWWMDRQQKKKEEKKDIIITLILQITKLRIILLY